jgi:catechol 2,3-dioxygenase-like lactoylglutathione lyase family enzyme
MLTDARVSTRLPAHDLARARLFYSEKLGLEPVEERPGGIRYQCGSGSFALFQSAGSASLVFEDYDTPRLTTKNGIADIEGNYQSKGVGERGAWFKDSEGNLLGLGQPVRG